MLDQDRPAIRTAELLQEAQPGIVAKAITMALEGDRQMIRLLLDRVIPTWIGTRLTVHPRSLDELEHMVTNGDLSLEDGKSYADFLGKLVEIREVRELESRIEALESRAG